MNRKTLWSLATGPKPCHTAHWYSSPFHAKVSARVRKPSLEWSLVTTLENRG